MDRPLIAILLDSSQLGGIETHVFHLASALKEAGVPAAIWFYQDYGKPHPIETQLQENGISYQYLPGSLSGLRKALLEHAPLILHTHGYKAGIFGRLCASTKKTPVVSTFHNGDLGEGILRLYTWLDRFTSRVSLNIAVSEEIASRLPVPPISLNNFVNLPEQKITPGTSVAFVGRLSHEKGPDLFLQLAKHQPNQDFLLYGSGLMESNLKHQKVANVQFMGQVSSMDAHWQRIGLLCLPSRQEGLPMVALEAMSRGIPVLAFGLGALPELIQQNVNGWIAPPGNVKVMSNMLQFWQTLPSEQRQQMAENCIATIARSYSREAVIPKVISVYETARKNKGLSWPFTRTGSVSSSPVTTEFRS